MLTAKDIMSTNVITIGPSKSVKELALLLSDNGISGVPVVNDSDTLLGIVTESDLIDQKKKIHLPTVVTILDSVFYLENPEKMEQEMKKMAGSKVEDIYTPSPVSIVETTSIEEIATIMAEKGIHSLPVLDGDDRLVGIVGRKDIIKTIIQ